MTFVPIAITFMTTLILAFLAQTITERIVALLFAGVALGIQIYIYPATNIGTRNGNNTAVSKHRKNTKIRHIVLDR